MKQQRTTRSVNLTGILASAIVLALALIIVPKQAMAATLATCPSPGTVDSGLDTDRDGFTDMQECSGITLIDGNRLPNGQLTILPCIPGVTGPERSNCVDLNSRDAFVLVTRATLTKIPSNPYVFILGSQLAGGLGTTIHEISTSRTDRLVTISSKQLAAHLVESLQPAISSTDPLINDVDLGRSNQGMLLDYATVFTQRIADFVNSVCVAGITCVDSNVATNGIATPQAVIDHYIRHTIAHELGGHVLTLAPVYNINFGGNHYQSGTYVVMEQSLKYTKKGTKVTWYISTTYTDPDRAAVKLQ